MPGLVLAGSMYRGSRPGQRVAAPPWLKRLMTLTLGAMQARGAKIEQGDARTARALNFFARLVLDPVAADEIVRILETPDELALSLVKEASRNVEQGAHPLA